MKQSQFPFQVDYLKRHYEVHPVPGLTVSQIQQIRKFANQLLTEEKNAPACFWLASLVPFAFMIPVLVGALVFLPEFLLAQSLSPLTVSLTVGSVLGFLAYSLTMYSVHECAGHSAFLRYAPKSLNFLKAGARNFCRFFLADPEYYTRLHVTHHAALGSEKDEGFAHFVSPKILLKSVLPGAGFLFHSDFQVTQNPELTPSKKQTLLMSALFFGSALFALSRSLGLSWALFTIFVVMACVGTGLDRLRQTWEHHWMPLDNAHGSRQLGPGWVGYFLGGGPWGQHSHMSHHLAPQLNWIQQHRMHFFLMRIFTEEQKFFFTFSSFAFFKNFPRLILRGIEVDRASQRS